MIQSLANLVKDEGNFAQSFRESVTLDHKSKKTPGNNQRVNELLEASRIFFIGQRQHVFDELETIFFMDKPISQRDYKNTPACNTCEHAWKNQKELKDSHCHFCGKSSCKDCMKKTRLFRTKKTPCKDETERGRICKLCDRKFIIKDMIQGSSTQIKTQNLVIENN